MDQAPLTLFFDVGDTLIRPRLPLHALYLKVVNDHHPNAVEERLFKQAMRQEVERMPMQVNGHFRYSDGWFTDFIYKVLEAVLCPKPWDGIMEDLFRLFEIASTFQIFEDVEACLGRIRKLGLRTAVVSNWGYRLDKLLNALGLGQGFEAIISSANVEREKPDPFIFEIALEKIGSTPDRTVHIGDNFQCDVLGAHAAGIHSVLLDRTNQHPEVEERILSLDALFSHLEKRGLDLIH